MVPGPNEYKVEKVKAVDSNDQAKWGFGTEKRKDMALGTISPGPGAYQTKSKAFDYEKPKFYVGEKISKLSPNTRVPMSWAYNPRLDSSR